MLARIGFSALFFEPASEQPFLTSPEIIITLDSPLALENFTVNEKPINVFSASNRTLQVTGLGNEKADVQLFDILGRSILKTSVSSDSGVKLGDIETGVYIVRISTLEGSLSKKIIIK